MFWNGSTAIDGLSGRESAAAAGCAAGTSVCTRYTRIACAMFLCRHIESAEARNTHRLSSHEGIENGVYDGLHRLSCRPLV